MLLGIGCEAMGAARRARRERQIAKIIVEAFIVSSGRVYGENQVLSGWIRRWSSECLLLS